MRPRNAVAMAALTAAFALVALPGLAGSATPSPEQIYRAADFQSVSGQALIDNPPFAGRPDSAGSTVGLIDASGPFIEPGRDPRVVPVKAIVAPPAVGATTEARPPRYTLSGYATFYDNGTTAMRLPRGTLVVICGPGGCLERTVTDYGPVKPSRVVDMYRPDFFAVCGCPSWSGTVWVTVKVY